ncbi:MAG: GNAT family N-acetyltransferase [archaeon]|nr:GNAT family N-acetyltransferase [archaeon]
MKRNIMDKEENIILVDTDNINNEEVIRGYVFARPIRDDELEGYIINALYVKEEFRKHGIAKELLNEILKLVNEKNPSFIDINVMYDNEVAKKLYEEINFKPFRLTMRLDK